MKKNPFSKTDRGISHYLTLKSDFESDSERLLVSLPLFTRIMFLDSPNLWVKEINRFDFIRLLLVDKNISILNERFNNFNYCKTIVPEDTHSVIEVYIEEFLKIQIIRLDKEYYTIQDFIRSVGYNGGLHMQTDQNNEKLKLLYEGFIHENWEVSFDFVKQISDCFINVFEEFYDLIVGDNNGRSTNRYFQAQLLLNPTRIYFNKAFIQFPIRKKEKKGIRICLEIMLIGLTNENSGTIYEYGHRLKDGLKITLYQSGSLFLFIVNVSERKKIIKYKLTEDFAKEFKRVEFSIYPDGKAIVAIDNILRVNEDLQSDIEIDDRKLILGSDLDGKKFGQFYEFTVTTQSIDKNNNMHIMGAYS